MKLSNTGILQSLNFSEVGITDGLVSWWPLNGNAKDLSGNANDGTISGATLASGLNGLCYSFDGIDNYIDCGNITYLNSLSQITVSCWVYSINFAQNAMLVMKNPVNTVWEMYFETNVWKWRGGGVGNNMVSSLPSNNNWHHLLVTQSGINTIMYMDGIAVKTGTSEILGTSSDFVNIGRYASTYYFNGKIEDVRIYNRALSAEEVNILYELGNTSNKVKQSKNTIYIKGEFNELL